MGAAVIQQIVFPCEGMPCIGSLHGAAGTTGILVVSGGQDPRAGAHRWQLELARALAHSGYPVLRFDRRGVGDSDGPPTTFRDSLPDMTAATRALRDRVPNLVRMVGLGNCDGATALALWGRSAGIDAAILLNPWLVPTADSMPPPAAVRARYRRRLTDATAWRRLLTGQLDLRRAWAGLRQATRADMGPLAQEVAQALAAHDALPAHLVLSSGDATAQSCAAVWKHSGFASARAHIPVTSIDTASHSFAGADDGRRLLETVLAILEAWS